MAQAGGDQAVPAPAERKTEDLDEILVTGSRIARSTDERLQPTMIIDSQRIEERQFINVADALKDLPAFSSLGDSLQGGQTQFSLGQSFANLFALGSNRTLTLIDGHRVVSADSITTQTASGSGGEEVDLNSIPTELIDRIEVVSVGGAPIYGSEAIAGTVNIIMKHDFEGLVMDAQRGVSGQGDARQSRVRFLGGLNFDDGRGNIEANVELAKTPELMADQRQLYRYGNFFVNSEGSSPYLYQLYPNVRLGGLSTSGVPTLSDTYLNFDPGSAVRNAAGQILAFNSQGQLARWTPGTPIGNDIFNTGGDGYDLNAASSLLTGEERINAGLLSRFDVNEQIRVTAEASFSETHNRGVTYYGGNSDSALCNGAGLPCGNLILSASNPFLSAADQATLARNLAAYSAIPGNPAQTGQFYLARADLDTESDTASVDQNTKSIRLGVGGSLPELGHDIKYEIYGSYGWLRNATAMPAINYQNFYNALDAVTSHGGAIICAPGYHNSPVATQSSQCAPFDPFGVGHQSAAALAYVTDLASATAINTQRDLEASVNGSLWPVPAGEIKFALGYENRRESMSFDPDQFYQQGVGQFPAIPPVAGAFHTNEVFGEVLIPVISPSQDMPFVHRIELEGAARQVDHSISGKMTTWTSGLRYEPASFLQLRGSYVKAIRAPSLTEAYTPPSFASEEVDDPCDQTLINLGPNPKARAANCAAAGIKQPFTSTFENLNGRQIIYSGNPNLQNELAASRALGFQIKPRDNLSLAVDYISINLTQAIQELDSDQVLDACYDGSRGNLYCSHVTRGADGQLQQIRPGFFNEAHLITNGVTADFRYEADVPFASVPGSLGTLTLNTNYYLQNRGALYIGDSDYMTIGGTIANSRHQATIDLAWRRGGLHADWSVLFVSHAAVDNALPPDYASTERVGGWWLNNASVAYEFGRHFRAQLNVDNVFDKEPPYPLPVVPPNFTGGGIRRYFSGVMGRYFILSAAYRL